MNSKLPLHRQQKVNTCALACLRMVLAAFGTEVEESVIEAQARLEPRGTCITEWERLARLFGLPAVIEETTTEQLGQLLAEGKLPIVYIDRVVYDLPPDEWARHSLRDAVMHTVVPTRVTRRTVTYHDPTGPRIIRRPIRQFRRAYEGLGGACVVCSAPSPPTPASP